MFGFRLKLTLLVTALLPLLIALGFWQLSRYEQKQVLEQAYDERRGLIPMTIEQAKKYQDAQYLPIVVSGHFDPERYFLLDNQTYQGQAGYELYMPFQTDENLWLWVNRGWIAAGRDREELPNVFTETSHLTITGFAYKPLGKTFMLADDHWVEGWPKRIQALDLKKMAAAVNSTPGTTTPDFFFTMKSHQPNAEQVRQVVINLKSEKHLGYAIQWFAMALVLLLLYGFQMIRSRQ